MKYARLLFALLLALCVVAHSCNEEPTALDARTTLSLSVVDSTCIDIELKLGTQNPNGQRLVVERQVANESPVVIFDATLNKPDTSILDTGLLPNTPYAYRAYRLASNTKTDASNNLLARTMDTTSHDWTWTLHTFGDASSEFNDVAIINDTLAYAVGKIYLRDSLGQNDPTPYNLAIWNGQSWKFERVLHFYQGNPLFSPLTSIFAFNENEIWLGAGGGLFRKNGQNWQVMLPGIDVFPASPVNKIWGRSSSDLYIVGNNGNIAHYNGFEWRRIESGTSLNVFSVHGNEDEVLAVAADGFGSIQGSMVIGLNGGGQSPTLHAPLTLSTATMSGLWFISNRRYFAVGSSNFEKRRRDGQEWKAVSIPSLVGNSHSMRIAGQSINDMFITATSSQILHFNGVSWRNFQNRIPGGEKWFWGIKVKNNLVIAVGLDVSSPSTRAVVAIGKRN